MHGKHAADARRETEELHISLLAEGRGTEKDGLYVQMETGEGLTLESVLGTEGMEEGLVEKVALRSAIEQLPEREQKVIFLRYFKNFTQQQAARVLDISQVQVSRIERKAVERLRKLLLTEE